MHMAKQYLKKLFQDNFLFFFLKPIHFSFLYSAANYGHFQHCAQHPPFSAAHFSTSPHPSDR